MIKNITLENFFSFGQSSKIELHSDLNILVGINGSGKSNFLKAIYFLYEGVAGKGLKNIFQKEWAGFETVKNFNETSPKYIKLTYEFCKEKLNESIDNELFLENPIYEITIHGIGNASYYLEEMLFHGNLNANENFHNIDSKNETGFTLTQQAEKIDNLSFKKQELDFRQMDDSQLPIQFLTIKNAIASIAIYDYFDTSLKSAIRRTESGDIHTRLLENGENLTQLLLRLKRKYPVQYAKIEELIREINPSFQKIEFEEIDAKMHLILREKKLNKTVGIEQISTGSLRFLLLLAIFLNPERGKIVSIDEPEAGLHPDMIHAIAESIKYASETSQMIIATHSPLLLNSFDIEDLLIFDQDVANKTVVVSRKKEEDFDDWNDDFLTGQLWLRGRLGGKRW